jgi:peptidoglycan/xylan/chitin deacetylase (PgdA/CDA1 family)
MKQPISKADSDPSTWNAGFADEPPSWFETPRTRWQLRLGLPLLYWRLSTAEKAIYLSFDDGPTRDITDPILDCLSAYQAKASFFCLGRSIEKLPDGIQRMAAEGHSVGNHTYSHLSGWRSSLRKYLDDVAHCDQMLPRSTDGRLPMFRPPYGQLGLVQGLRLALSRRIVMWDLNSMDYRGAPTPAEIAQRVCQFARPGSIVLMHDSVDVGRRTVEALPRILETLGQRGFCFKAI